MKWNLKKANNWYNQHDWLVGCNFLPSSSINQLEMFQKETFDILTIKKEIKLASGLGFNVLRVYLHDLLWKNKKELITNIKIFLNICGKYKIKVILVLFDDCHRPFPTLGKQPKPVKGVHNSGWVASPGKKIIDKIHSNKIEKKDIDYLKNYTQGILQNFNKDKRILMWDLYNEPGALASSAYSLSLGKNKSLKLLKLVWKWAREVNVSQPLTSCTQGSVGKKLIDFNKKNSDIITFHDYDKKTLLRNIKKNLKEKRPVICTEYMAREFGTTFQFSLPIFKKYKIGCINWGLVVGKSQTHFNWKTVEKLESKIKKKQFLKKRDKIPEPKVWFHDIFRIDGSPYDKNEINIIKKNLSNK